MKKTLAIISISTALITALSGCTQPPASGGKFSSIDELKTAYIKAGGSCPSWKQSNVITSALQSGDCDSSSVLSLYGSADAATSSAMITKNGMVKMGMSPHLLVGENWVINSPQVESLQTKMGGLLIK